MNIDQLLTGGDLRSIGRSNAVALSINNQKQFDELFNCLFHKNRLVASRAADAIEKITITKPEFLINHKKEIFFICKSELEKELKWHIALLLPRLKISKKELLSTWNLLTVWAKDKSNSRIVRVNSIQGLFELTKKEKELAKDFKLILIELKKENIPSINARIRIIGKQIK